MKRSEILSWAGCVVGLCVGGLCSFLVYRESFIGAPVLIRDGLAWLASVVWMGAVCWYGWGVLYCWWRLESENIACMAGLMCLVLFGAVNVIAVGFVVLGITPPAAIFVYSEYATPMLFGLVLVVLAGLVFAENVRQYFAPTQEQPEREPDEWGE